MNKPELSIVMPVYNAEKFIFQSIQSLLNQSFRDFELIIVDDGSTDRSLKIVQNFSDSRIKILTNPHNQGIVFSRNKGLREAKGVFYAPFDADDITLPDKFLKQIDFLKKNHDYSMVGSFATLIDGTGKPTGKKWKLPASSVRIPSIMLFRNYFVHSSLVIKASALPPAGYAEGFDRVEDYLLAFKICLENKTHNLPEYLVKYRVHNTSATSDYEKQVLLQDEKVYRYIFSQLEIELTPSRLGILCVLKDQCVNQLRPEAGDVQDFLLLILAQNQKLRLIDHEQLHKEVINRWLKFIFNVKVKSFFNVKSPKPLVIN